MTDESPMHLIRRIMVRQAIRNHKQSVGIGTIIMPINNDESYIFHGTIATVQNSYNPNFFGAFLRLENFLLEVGNEKANVDVLITLPEVNEEYLIRDILVRFNSAKNYRGKDLKKFVSRVPKAIADAWNEEN